MASTLDARTRAALSSGPDAPRTADELLPLDIDRPLLPPDRFDRVVYGAIGIAERIWQRIGLLGLLAAATVGAIAVATSPGIHSHPQATLVAALAAACCAAVAWQGETAQHRAGWAAIALGAVLWCGGLGRGLGPRPPALSLSIGDAAAIGAMACFSLGILILLEKPTRDAARVRFLAELFMVCASVLFAGWVTVLPAAFAAAEGHALRQQAVVLAFPISDVLLLGVVAFACAKLPLLGRWSVVLLPAAGAIALLPSAAPRLQDVDLPVDAVGLVAVLAFAGIALAASRAWRAPRQGEAPPVPERAQLLLLIAPGLSVLIVVGTTIRQVTGRPVAVELTWITIAVLTFAVLLHVSVTVENHLLGRELALARDEAIHASVLKSHFLANVSHEIRTPMNAVIGLTGLLLDSDLDADQRDYAEGVATSAEGLLGLIDSLLDFSKIEAEKLDLEEIDLDLTDLIDEVAMIVGEPARRKGIELVAYCEPGLATARRGDPVRLRQILLNLANNAVKFTHEGSVTIQAVPRPGEPDDVSFLVIDTGIGIPEEEQQRLFEPFSQLDESTTRTYGGTGLGLGIVRGLVDLMGGTVEMASEVGVGTVFRITLPLPRAASPADDQGLSALVGMRALVVDDNAVNRSVLAHTMHSWGFEVDQAASAEEALHRYGWRIEGDDPTYDVAVIERNLDGMDGVELARHLHEQAPSGRAPATVTLLLSSTMDISRRAAKEAGIESVLIRPVRTSYLLRRIVDALVTTPTATSEELRRPTRSHSEGTEP